MVPEGCCVIGDDGFTGKGDNEKKTCSVRNNSDKDEVAEFKSRAKSRHESFNSRMKSCQVLCQRFRHGVKKHGNCFSAMLVSVQCAVEDASPDGEPLDTLQSFGSSDNNKTQSAEETVVFAVTAVVVASSVVKWCSWWRSLVLTLQRQHWRFNRNLIPTFQWQQKVQEMKTAEWRIQNSPIATVLWN